MYAAKFSAFQVALRVHLVFYVFTASILLNKHLNNPWKNVSGNFYATNSKPLFMMCVSYLFFPCFKFDVLAKLCNLYNIHELIHIIWKFNGSHWLILCVYLHVYGHIYGMIHMGRQEELFLPLYHLGFWCLTQISRIASKHPYLLYYLKKKNKKQIKNPPYMLLSMEMDFVPITTLKISIFLVCEFFLMCPFLSQDITNR